MTKNITLHATSETCQFFKKTELLLHIFLAIIALSESLLVVEMSSEGVGSADIISKVICRNWSTQSTRPPVSWQNLWR